MRQQKKTSTKRSPARQELQKAPARSKAASSKPGSRRARRRNLDIYIITVDMSYYFKGKKVAPSQVRQVVEKRNQRALQEFQQDLLDMMEEKKFDKSELVFGATLPFLEMVVVSCTDRVVAEITKLEGVVIIMRPQPASLPTPQPRHPVRPLRHPHSGR